ncbi:MULTISPECIES: two-component system response regulator RssB [unclassified Tatumella]|uniref:two-component system response regulator RssB n=1 Tax=unclassified Tatumella TaxID=2649542 RepID=UPI001BAED97E|nr:MULTISPECIES: two-component system response regulator RssB [unclassified Tatumella]MBS0876289.1 two-component system response regulator RssB [Tatumella sp. JGM82]MBS0889338.1 two-component system response regulator RssB [Tatumella sp. JGM94]MBS0902248.1 two-component system response regulator RssB [Tatumella sp. JGM100]
MSNPLSGKNILVAEDEAVFSAVICGFIETLGANTLTASDGKTALDIIDHYPVDLIICDLEMPIMRGDTFVEQLRARGNALPVVIVTASEDVSEIARMLRLGVQDVILKPVDDLTRVRDVIMECLYPSMFVSKIEEDEQLFDNWDVLIQQPEQAIRLIKQLQPPIRQLLANTRITYRQLTYTDQPGLVFDIAALSDHQLGFYIMDVTRAGNNGIMAALLLRVMFNQLLQEKITGQQQKLPQIATILNDINRLLQDAGMSGQFPLLVGYYHQPTRQLLLVPAGLDCDILFDGVHQTLGSGIPAGTFEHIHGTQHCFYLRACECNIRGSGGKLTLMLRANE